MVMAVDCNGSPGTVDGHVGGGGGVLGKVGDVPGDDSQVGRDGDRAGWADGNLAWPGDGGKTVCTLEVVEGLEVAHHQRIHILQLLLESPRLHTRTRGKKGSVHHDFYSSFTS